MRITVIWDSNVDNQNKVHTLEKKLVWREGGDRPSMILITLKPDRDYHQQRIISTARRTSTKDGLNKEDLNRGLHQHMTTILENGINNFS